MTEPFFNRLSSYFRKVGEILRGEADAASIFPNPTDKGISREAVYARVLRQHLPLTCNVFFGGFLFDQDGRESHQIDLIITNGVSPRFDLITESGVEKSFACIDGCIGVVSLKSVLTGGELQDCLNNLASLPDKMPLTPERQAAGVRINNYQEWPFKVIHARDGVDYGAALATLEAYYKHHPDILLHKRPNVIHVAGKYVILRLGPEGGQTRDGTKLEANSYYPMRDSTDVYGLMFVIQELQSISHASYFVFYDYSNIMNRLPIAVTGKPSPV